MTYVSTVNALQSKPLLAAIEPPIDGSERQYPIKLDANTELVLLVAACTPSLNSSTEVERSILQQAR